jgi:hypothetical protein
MTKIPPARSIIAALSGNDFRESKYSAAVNCPASGIPARDEDKPGLNHGRRMLACVGEESVDGARRRRGWLQVNGSEQMPRLRRLVNGDGTARKERLMAFRAFLTLCIGASLFIGGVALAEQAGTTSGPAAGKNVEPSTATEKKYEGKQETGKGAPAAAGSPGVEAKPGTEGGKAAQPGK